MRIVIRTSRESPEKGYLHMSNLWKRGQVLRSRHSNQTYTVEDFLVGGGQGEVYRAKWGTDSFALI
jgi:hypothetical protein